MDNRQNLLRQLPAIEKLLNSSALNELFTTCPRPLVVEAAQETIADLRQAILRGDVDSDNLDLSVDTVAQRAAQRAINKFQTSLRHVINATGTILHTNLGRAPLSDDALQAVDKVARSYSNLELDLKTGQRGHRYSHIDELLCRLTGAEAAAVVNNNAGAVLLALTALAQGKEAIVSRGELVEIGGAFRVPDVMEAGGVILREVGTTNKTHMKDYRGAINENTGLLLKVHTSNYRIVGFTSQVPAAEMVALGREHNIPVMEDLGSGMLFDLSPFGLPREPTVAEAVEAGIDVLTFSGDKLLGGPQAGLIVGKKWAIDKIRHHPLARALRIDKLTLAAMEATLRHYLEKERAIAEVPVLRLLNMSASDVEKRCQRLATQLQERLGDQAEISIVPEPATVGGGALPLTLLDGFALAVAPRQLSVDTLSSRLRAGSPPVVGRIQDDRLLLNPRTVFPAEEETLVVQVLHAITTQD